MKINIRLLLLVLGVLLLSLYLSNLSTSKYLSGFNTHKITYRVVFTSGLDNSMPIDNLNSLSINAKRIILFTYWYYLKPNINYKYDIIIHDGENNLICTNEIIFKPTNISCNTRSFHQINPKVDKAGDWKFEVYLNDKKMLRNT